MSVTFKPSETGKKMLFSQNTFLFFLVKLFESAEKYFILKLIKFRTMLKEISSEQLNKVLAINSGSWTKIRK